MIIVLIFFSFFIQYTCSLKCTDQICYGGTTSVTCLFDTNYCACCSNDLDNAACCIQEETPLCYDSSLQKCSTNPPQTAQYICNISQTACWNGTSIIATCKNGTCNNSSVTSHQSQTSSSITSSRSHVTSGSTSNLMTSSITSSSSPSATSSSMSSVTSALVTSSSFATSAAENQTSITSGYDNNDNVNNLNSKSTSNSNATVIGSSIGGGLLFILIIIFVIVILLRRRKSTKKENNTYGSLELRPVVVTETSYDVIISPNRGIPTKAKSLTSPSLEIPFHEITIGEKLGIGAYGEVYKGKWRNQDVAIKKIKNGLEQMENEFMSESKLMMALRPHENVVTFYGVCTNPPCIILRFYEKGSLLTYLEKESSISWETKLNIMKGIAAGMSHLHQEKIIHRDLAARNILLTNRLEAVVSDFGFARLLQQDDGVGSTSSNIGPIKHMSPESLVQSIYSEKTDSWAFGVTCWEIIAQQVPYEKMNGAATITFVMAGNRLTIPKNTDEKVANLIQSCWNESPELRPTLQECFDQLQKLAKGS